MLNYTFKTFIKQNIKLNKLTDSTKSCMLKFSNFELSANRFFFNSKFYKSK